MIRFEPFPIVISGNKRDDLLYEWWQYETQHNPAALKPANLDVIERRAAVGPDAKAFEEEVFETLLRIGTRKVGRQVLAATFSLPEKLYILPFGERDVVMRGRTASKCPADDAHISLTNPKDKVPPVKIALGDHGACRSRLFATETTLVHELVHAARPNQNFLLNTATGDRWTNLEEFFGVVVENVYRSERGDTVLRGGHDASLLAANLSTSAGFMSDNTLAARVQTVFSREPLARKLARFPEIKFNPFALAKP